MYPSRIESVKQSPLNPKQWCCQLDCGVTYPDGEHRIEIKNGTKFHVAAKDVNPPEDGNALGHGVVFLSTGGEWGPNGMIANVWCFFPMPQGS
jgi:hypothetical protein